MDEHIEVFAVPAGRIRERRRHDHRLVCERARNKQRGGRSRSNGGHKPFTNNQAVLPPPRTRKTGGKPGVSSCFASSQRCRRPAQAASAEQPASDAESPLRLAADPVSVAIEAMWIRIRHIPANPEPPMADLAAVEVRGRWRDTRPGTKRRKSHWEAAEVAVAAAVEVQVAARRRTGPTSLGHQSWPIVRQFGRRLAVGRGGCRRRVSEAFRDQLPA